jgi:hypothetical protein
MSKSSNQQRIHVFKLWLASLESKVKRPKVTKVIYEEY